MRASWMTSARLKKSFSAEEDRLSLAEMMRSRSPRRPSDEQITAHLGVLLFDLPAVLDATIELDDAEWQKLLDAVSGFYTPELSFADGA